ncbi:MAG: putative flap endonuclease-1-like 5' DNA nuclease [Rhodothermales bacterium]|jgi:predicted flap endonuclease-1-like 5' DNA nuclease
MPYLLLQIFLCLLIAFLIGLIIGWWIARNRFRSKLQGLENEVAELRAALAACQTSKTSGARGLSGATAGAAAGAATGGAVAAAAIPLAAPIPSADPDDLKVIWGIGPKMEELLKASGINTFRQVAGTSVAQLQEIVAAYGSKRLTDIANEEVWPEQAEMAARGDWAALKAYQEKLSWRDGGGKPTS